MFDLFDDSKPKAKKKTLSSAEKAAKMEADIRYQERLAKLQEDLQKVEEKLKKAEAAIPVAKLEGPKSLAKARLDVQKGKAIRDGIKGQIKALKDAR